MNQQTHKKIKVSNAKIKTAIKELSANAKFNKDDIKAIRWNLLRLCTNSKGKIDFDKLVYEFSKIILEQSHIFTFNDTDEIMMYDDNGTYRVGEKKILSYVQKVLVHNAKNHRINEILGHIKRQTYKSRDDAEENPHKICLNNGVLNLKTLKIEKHNPKLIFYSKIPVTYDKNAKCPKINKFLNQIVNSDDITNLQEIAGYVLYKKYFIHKAIMFVGGGANGKSTFINLIKEFIGKENCVSIPLQHLEEDKFALANLYGKLSNLFADLPSRALRNTSIFKMLVGEDLIPAEKKFKDKFFFTNFAKQIFSANQVPISPDDTDAFFRRWVIIIFPNQFVKDKADKRLLSKLTTPEELSGFFNFALTGLKRLIKNQDFSNTASIEQIRELYLRLSDSVQAFVMDKIDIAPESYEVKRELYTAYTDYCRLNKYVIVSENVFHKNLQKLIRIEDYRPLINGARVTCWRGIKLKIMENTPDIIDNAKTTDLGLGQGSQGKKPLLIKTKQSPKANHKTEKDSKLKL